MQSKRLVVIKDKVETIDEERAVSSLNNVASRVPRSESAARVL
jgi:hypothetical protein